MIQLVREFKWFLITPVIVLALVSFLIVGLVMGGQSASGRLSVANTQLQQAHDDLDKTQNRLYTIESQLANVEDNGEESFYRGVWFLCMALKKGEQPEICSNIAISFLVNNYHNTELPTWDWSYVRDTANGQP